MDAGTTAPTAPPTFLVVLSDPDVVARGVGDRWGTPSSTGEHLDGAAVRELEPRLLVVRRAGPHIHDERLDLRLPTSLAERRPTLLFPSVHRSESQQHCFTVHPLGNPGLRADLGGRPRTLVPTDPRAMTGLLRVLDESARSLGTTATFEATHHGPELAAPALFAEISVTEEVGPTREELTALAQAIRSFGPDPLDQVALAVGGGHYAPRFTDLARSRRWAFGHILSRHALDDLDPTTARAGLDATPGASGIVFARAQDRAHRAFAGLGPALRESDAPRRPDLSDRASARSLPTSGT